MADLLFSIMATMPSGKERRVWFLIDKNPDEGEAKGAFAWGVFERVEGDEENDEIVFHATTEKECEEWCTKQIAAINEYITTGRFDDY